METINQWTYNFAYIVYSKYTLTFRIYKYQITERNCNNVNVTQWPQYVHVGLAECVSNYAQWYLSNIRAYINTILIQNHFIISIQDTSIYDLQLYMVYIWDKIETWAPKCFVSFVCRPNCYRLLTYYMYYTQ